jgi:hypothetical protein
MQGAGERWAGVREERGGEDGERKMEEPRDHFGMGPPMF